LLNFQAPTADGAVDGCVLLQASMGKHRLGVLVLVDHAGWGRDRRARMVGTRPPRTQAGARFQEARVRVPAVEVARPERNRRGRDASAEDAGAGRVSRKHESGVRLLRARGRSAAAGTWPGCVRRRRGASQKVFFSNFETDHGYWGSPATR